MQKQLSCQTLLTISFFMLFCNLGLLMQIAFYFLSENNTGGFPIRYYEKREDQLELLSSEQRMKVALSFAM